MLHNLKLRFDYDNKGRFSSLCTELSGLLRIKYPGKVFCFDAQEECLSRFSSNFWGPTNRINGWLIKEEDIGLFDVELSNNNVGSEWDEYRFSIWAYFGGEYTGKWLFSTNGPIFGEVVL